MRRVTRCQTICLRDRAVALILAWGSLAAAGVGFFLPWVRVDIREPALVQQAREGGVLGEAVSGLTRDVNRIALTIRRGAETLVGELPAPSDLPRQLSGFQIPQLLNQQETKTVLAVAEALTGRRYDLGRRSYAVYLVPGLALLCGVLLTWRGRLVVVAVGVAVLCAGIAGAGFWRALTLKTATPLAAISIGPGVWWSLWAYVGLAVAALGSWLPTPPSRRAVVVKLGG